MISRQIGGTCRSAGGRRCAPSSLDHLRLAVGAKDGRTSARLDFADLCERHRRADSSARAGRRDQARGRLARLPARARGPGHQRPAGAQPRPPEERQRGHHLARDHVGLPGAGVAAARGLPRARPAPSANRPPSQFFGSPHRACALRQLRRGVPRRRRRHAPIRRRAGGEQHRGRRHPLARPAAAFAAAHRGRDQPAGAPPPAAPVQFARRHRGGAGPSAGAGAVPELAQQAPARMPSGAPSSSNAEGARLAATNPAWAGHRQRTRRHRVRPAHRRPRDPGRPVQPHPLRRGLPAADAGSAARPRAATASAWWCRCRTGPAPSTTCWCRSSSTASR